MADKVVLADTSILIDYFRKSDKSNSVWLKLFDQGYNFFISAITEYEIYSGATELQHAFWNNILKQTTVLPFDQMAAKIAVEINKDLKRKRKQIDLADLFIASTALAYDLPIATLNKKHFDRVERLLTIE